MQEKRDDLEMVTFQGKRVSKITLCKIGEKRDMRLTDPFLQLPDENSVHVVWFTECDSDNNRVLLYENSIQEGPSRVVPAQTTKMSRMRGGKTEMDCNNSEIFRHIWRHEAIIDKIPRYHGSEEEKVPYCVISDNEQSDIYTLQAKPQPGTPMKILLTSDIQNKHMCAANFQKVYEKIGVVDAVLVNGDIPNVADRAYDWFDGENAFFRVLQGRTAHIIHDKVYHGGKLIQNAPIYAAIGNHDVMGRYSTVDSLHNQSNNTAQPDVWNTVSWEEVFSLPQSETGGKRYYAVTIGDIRLIVLAIANAWRVPKVGLKGKYSEKPGESMEEYGFGQMIYEPIKPGSRQLEFLEQELNSEEFKKAKYKMVMFHWQHHSLGMNQVPAFTDPVVCTVKDPVTGLDMVIYDYPLEQDYIAKYVEPLLEKAGVNVMFNAHSHLWNRFQTERGMNIIESSHVGGTDGACYDAQERLYIPSVFAEDDPRHCLAKYWNRDNYILKGDPYGLTPIMPTLAGVPENKPYLSNKSMTVFSILDTGKGCIDSYYFDTDKPDSEMIHFDVFPICELNTIS